jgi:hypothetical protein
MSVDVSGGGGRALGRSRQAWLGLGDQFEAIGKQFRQNYDRVTETATAGTEKSQASIERAVKSVGKALEDTSKAIGDSLRDPRIREETEEAGAKLLHAVGVTLAELGEALQREAEEEERNTAA